MTLRLNLCVLTLFGLAIAAVPALAQLPNVRYHVEIVAPPAGSGVWVNQINNHGVVVGHFSNRAFIYIHPTGRLYSMNSDTDLQPVRDQLTQLFGADWFFNSAAGINDLGQIVGRVENIITGQKKGFALDTFNFSSPASWMILPLPEIVSTSSFGYRVNAQGQVLGIYRRADNSDDCFLCNPWTSPTTPAMPFGISLFQGNVGINNFGQVAGLLSTNKAFFDGSPSPGLPNMQVFKNLSGCLSIGGVNDLGIFSVNGRSTTTKRPFALGALGTFRVSGLSNQQERILDGGYPVGINYSGDVAIDATGPNYIAYNGSSSVLKQALKVTDLIEASDPLKALLVNVNNTLGIQAINDRDSTTGFGQLTGRLFTANGMFAVVLTPYIP